ncbi:DNA endonuclease SmrA [Methylococcus capsulatus]|uniref:Smr domain protein n=1 Tax=Methylococcus capsulatus (strain ATCC 33009 / NCIMB 11132 / Bath) TaxID=243233 RepID=Q60AI6_METCA|nr:DNA endonuclease SmrA [Methylococcus capsulatus]AAU93016.1 Smr domain protein [Methylococcus capsulatus str. Bath]QXP88360.1 DNA endonuclease SmrA [Methylococcus capsulatus]QXP94623.1 DNA endonuclease SmrA [Methylococcus capsulatus]UQN13402.1 DNA endonuclease SmrA [Methylococcus capsulatus]
MNTDDKELFRREMEDVTPLKPSDRAFLRPQEAPTPGQLYRRSAAQRATGRDANFLTTDFVEFVDRESVLSFRRQGIQRAVFRKLEEGAYEIEAVLDLHFLSVEEARTAVFEFIRDCMKHDVRTVLINHGKGGREAGKPTYLKSYVARWLPQFDEVLAFHSARRWHGGTGAVYVMLRKSERQKQITRQKLGLTSVKPK